MTDTLSFVVPGEPTPKARARVVRGRTYTPERTRLAEEEVAWEARKHWVGKKADPDGRYAIELWFYCRSKRQKDIDNLAKTYLDAMKGILWQDDHQVYFLTACKMPVDSGAHTKINVWKIGGRE